MSTVFFRLPSIYTFIVIVPFPLTLTFLDTVFSFTLTFSTCSSSTFTINSTSFGLVVVSFPSSSVVLLSVYPVNDLTLIVTVPVFVSANLFTVIVIFVPSSTVFPESILCFNTTPFPLVLSSPNCLLHSVWHSAC